jgi:hypothetical protein
VFNPDRLSVEELSALRDLQRCVSPPPSKDLVWARLCERGLRLVKLREPSGATGVSLQVLTARCHAYRTE